MFVDFQTWLKNHTLEEASRRGMMGYIDPHEDKAKVEKSPQQGDIIITATATFFRGPKARSFYKDGPGPRRQTNTKINPWFIDGREQNGMVQAVYIPNPAVKKQFSAEDILHDVTDAYPAQDRMGRNVWLYIPSDDPAKQKMFLDAYNKFMSRHHSDPAEFARQADQAEDQEKAQHLALKASLMDDPTKAVHQHADNERLGFYKHLASQVTTMLKSNEDPSILLKRSFADDENAHRPEFIDWLRRKRLDVLADYLSGKDIRAAFAKPADDLNQRLAAQTVARPEPAAAQDDAWGKLFQMKAPEKNLDQKWNDLFYRQAQDDERDPLAAMKKPMPLTRAEAVRHHGAVLVGEARRPYYTYF